VALGCSIAVWSTLACNPGWTYVAETTCQDPLPVELSSVEATVHGDQITLHWTTASETNNAGFDIELELGTDIFEKVGHVEGYGTTLEPREYTYTVSDLSPGRYVFRLKQIDFDGAFAYSETVAATVALPDQFVLESAYPNPFNPSTTIRFAVATEQGVTLTLIDAHGRRVRTLYQGDVAANESHLVRIDGEGLASGSYVVRLAGNGFVATERVVLAK
jgi:hypothetical protein